MTDVRKWFNDKGINPDVALKAGVKYDPKLDAILYPRSGMDHIPIGWKIRELNTGKQYYFPKGVPLRDTEPFMALDGGGCLCICEGETDALTLATWQMWLSLEDPKVIAVPGATSFSNEWSGMYRNYEDVYLFPDPDEAGEKLVQKVCSLMPRTRVVRLDEEWGDLSRSLRNKLGEVDGRIVEAEPVRVKAPLRRTSYSYKRDTDIPKHKLVDVVVKYTQLKRRGKELTGNCPLHKEDTPSFMVDPDKGLFFCHGCSKGGDVISFLKYKEGLSYGQAKRKAMDL